MIFAADSLAGRRYLVTGASSGLGRETAVLLSNCGATLALAAPDPILASLCALVVTNTLQTVMQGGWMAWREPAGLLAAFTCWRSAMWVGVLSACGSACWCP